MVKLSDEVNMLGCFWLGSFKLQKTLNPLFFFLWKRGFGIFKTPKSVF